MSDESPRACAGRAVASAPGLHRPRRPEHAVLHALVRGRFETRLARKREGELEKKRATASDPSTPSRLAPFHK